MIKSNTCRYIAGKYSPNNIHTYLLKHKYNYVLTMYAFSNKKNTFR